MMSIRQWIQAACAVLQIMVFGAAARAAGEERDGKTASPDTTIENVSPREAMELINANRGNPGFIILDVRMPEEFAEGHIADSRNIDFKSDAFGDSVATLDKTKTYLVYCRTSNRSPKAAARMKSMGFAAVYNMLEGIKGWTHNDFPVEK